MEVTKEDKDQMNEAILMAAEGQLDDALDILLDFEKEYPDYLPLKMIIGKLYFEHEQYENSVEYFAEVVQNNPTIELVSLAYYHALTETENLGGALKEFERYLSQDDVQISLYLPTIEELHAGLEDSNMAPAQKEMVRKYYQENFE